MFIYVLLGFDPTHLHANHSRDSSQFATVHMRNWRTINLTNSVPRLGVPLVAITRVDPRGACKQTHNTHVLLPPSLRRITCLLLVDNTNNVPS